MALAWVFPDEKSSFADTVLDRAVEEGAYVPVHWKLEVANALRTGVRRQRCTAEFESDSLLRLERLSIATDRETDAHAWGRTRELAAEHDLTIYDAAYLELAIRRAGVLATLDSKLAEAGRRAGLEVMSN